MKTNLSDNLVEATESQMEGWSWIELLGVIWRRRMIVLVVTVVSLGSAFLYLAFAPALYESTSRIYVEQKGPKIITEQQGVMTASKNYLYTQCELLLSTPILANAVEILEGGGSEMKIFSGINNRVTYLKGALEASVGRKDDIISLTMESAYPEEASRLVNTVVEAYIEFHSLRKQSKGSEVLKVLGRGKVEWDNEWRATQQALVDFTRKNGTMSFENNGDNIISERLAQLSKALTEVQLEIQEAQISYESVKAMISDPSQIRQLVEAQKAKGDFLAFSNEETHLRNELEGLEKKLRDLRQENTFEHPAVKSTWVKISQVKRRLIELETKCANAYCNALIERLVTAIQKENQIKSSLAQQQGLALEQNTKAVEYAKLQSDLSRIEKSCDMLNNKIKELDLTEDVGALNITILERSQVPELPVKPHKARIVSIALFIGLLFGVVLGLMRDGADRHLRNGNEISAIIQAPVLGIVPSMSASVLSTGSKKGVSNCGTVVHDDPMSPMAEAYRSIRTAVYFGAGDRNGKTLLITSPGSGEGKSTLVSNLGSAMAQAGQRILIIDGDFRKPDQHKIFNINTRDGLCTVLGGSEELSGVIRPTMVEGLDLLPSGSVGERFSGFPGRGGPAELLSSNAFLEILGKLSGQYDRIIIDSPPVMYVTDARILGAICDETILVLQGQKSTRNGVEYARNDLLNVGANILGAVVNNVSAGNGRYSYYGSYMHNGNKYGYKSNGVEESNGNRHDNKDVKGAEGRTLGGNLTEGAAVIKAGHERVSQYKGDDPGDTYPKEGTISESDTDNIDKQ